MVLQKKFGVDEKKHTEYIREKVSWQGFTARQMAKYLNITKSAVEKIYTRDDINVSRIVKLSVFLKKDLFAFYYEKDPLKKIHQSTNKKLRQEINSLKKIISEKDEIIEDKKNIIALMQKNQHSSDVTTNES